MNTAIDCRGMTRRFSAPKSYSNSLGTLPSFAEGLPVVIMEALACGRPVVSTYIARIPELVVPGKNGWLVPAGSVTALAEALRDVSRTPVSTLIEMGQEGRRAIEAHYHNPTLARELAALFLSGSLR